VTVKNLYFPKYFQRRGKQGVRSWELGVRREAAGGEQGSGEHGVESQERGAGDEGGIDRLSPIPQRSEAGAQIAYFNASGRMHFFQSRAYGWDTVRGVAKGKKPAENYEKTTCCGKKRMHFGGDSDVFSDGQAYALVAMGQSHSRFSSRRRRRAAAAVTRS